MSEKAIADLKQAGQEIKDKALQLVNDAQTKAKEIKPIDAGIAFGVSLLLAVGLHISTKQKEDSFLTFGVLVYSIFTGIFAILLAEKPLKEQFPFIVTIFSFIRLIFEIKPISVLTLSLAPVLVNVVAEQVKKSDVVKKAVA